MGGGGGGGGGGMWEGLEPCGQIIFARVLPTSDGETSNRYCVSRALIQRIPNPQGAYLKNSLTGLEKEMNRNIQVSYLFINRWDLENYFRILLSNEI